MPKDLAEALNKFGANATNLHLYCLKPTSPHHQRFCQVRTLRVWTCIASFKIHYASLRRSSSKPCCHEIFQIRNCILETAPNSQCSLQDGCPSGYYRHGDGETGPLEKVHSQLRQPVCKADMEIACHCWIFSRLWPVWPLNVGVLSVSDFQPGQVELVKFAPEIFSIALMRR